MENNGFFPFPCLICNAPLSYPSIDLIKSFCLFFPFFIALHCFLRGLSLLELGPLEKDLSLNISHFPPRWNPLLLEGSPPSSFFLDGHASHISVSRRGWNLKKDRLRRDPVRTAEIVMEWGREGVDFDFDFDFLGAGGLWRLPLVCEGLLVRRWARVVRLLNWLWFFDWYLW